jgi:hypothetical protein
MLEFMGTPLGGAETPDPRARPKNIWDRISAGAGRYLGTPGGLLQDDQAAAGRQGILGMGASLLRNMGPSTERRSLLQNIGEAIPAGQVGAQQGVQSALMGRELDKKRKQEEAMAGWLGEGGPVDEMRLRNLFAQQMGTGDIEGARATAEILKSMAAGRGAAGKAPTMKEMENAEGDLTLHQWDPQKQVWTATGQQGPSGAAQERANRGQEMQHAATYETRIRPLNDAFRLINSVQGEIDQAKAGSGIAQVSLLSAFVRAMDPNSVVREGEARLTQEAATFKQRMVALANEMLANKARVIPESVVADIQRVLDSQTQAYSDEISSIYENMDRMREHAILPGDA